MTRFRTQKTASLLAYLAYHLNRSHSRESLIEILWPEADEKSGRNNLSMALSFLRHPLEPPGELASSVLIADRSSVRLNPVAVTTDVIEFESLVGGTDESDSTTESAQRLEEAIALYRGPLLPNFYEEWADSERDRLAEMYLGAVRRLTRILVQRREFDRALDFAMRAVSADPLREESHRDVMRLLVATNQPTAALRQYAELERITREELGESPSAATRQLANEIEERLRAAPSSAPPAFSLPTSPPAAPLSDRTLFGGTVTFLLTDIEGSTAHWQRNRAEFRDALRLHHAALRQQFRCHRGVEVQDAGDSFITVFAGAGDALACAVTSQRSLSAISWPETIGPLQVRMALHTGDIEQVGGEYRGIALHLASRIVTAGHGGQILCSESTANLVRRNLAAGLRLKDLGVYRLRDVDAPERLFQVDYPGGAAQFPSLHARSGHASHLPQPLTRFFGRDAEITELVELLNPSLAESGRLVTLTGPGGTGKTRLSLQVAQRLLDAFQGAVWFAPLADLENAQLIPEAILESLKIPLVQNVDPLDQVCETLDRQPCLLILDNFEHLVDEGTEVARTILYRAPRSTFLVSSRRPLELSFEKEFPVSPLPVPVRGMALERLVECESVQLFVDRARASRPDFQLTDRNAAAVADLCAALDGLPLAIELAAARAQVLTPAQMLSQLSNRLDLLSSRQRDWAERHRTLRATIEWSFRLLNPELQQFFARLSVFRGGCTLDAAESVCGDSMALDHLSLLRSHSLIVTEEDGDEMRYRMLEALREFGQEQLSPEERDELAGQHARWFTELAAQAEPHLTGPEQASWLERLARDHDNIRAVLTWCEERPTERVETALDLSASVWRFWWTRGHIDEGRRNLSGALERSAALAPSLNRLRALNAAGIMAFFQGDMTTARVYWEECVELAEPLGEVSIGIRAYGNLAYIATSLGEYDSAKASMERCLEVSRSIGDEMNIANALSSLGVIAYRQGDHAAARGLQEESLVAFEKLGHQWGIANCHANLGFIALKMDRHQVAQEHERKALSMLRDLGDVRLTAVALEYLSAALAASDQRARAATLLGAAAALRESANAPILQADQSDYDSIVQAARQGEPRFQAAWDEGHSLPIDEALNLALEPDSKG